MKITTTDIEQVLNHKHVDLISDNIYAKRFCTVDISAGELPEFDFYLMRSTSSTDEKVKDKIKNSLVFDIKDVEAVERAAQYTNEKCMSEDVKVQYPIFGKNFTGFEKREMKKGVYQLAGVGLTFSSIESIGVFINALFSSTEELDNAFDGYFLNNRKLTDIECIIRDPNAIRLLMTELDSRMYIKSLFSENDDRPVRLDVSSEIENLQKALHTIPLTWPEFGITDKQDVTESEWERAEKFLAVSYSTAQLLIDSDYKLRFDSLESRYFQTDRHYCYILEMLESICLYVMTRMMFFAKQNPGLRPQPKYLQKIFDVPHGYLSTKQIAFFLEVKETSLSSVFATKNRDGVAFKDKLVCLENYGRRRRFLPMELLDELLMHCSYKGYTITLMEGSSASLSWG